MLEVLSFRGISTLISSFSVSLLRKYVNISRAQDNSALKERVDLLKVSSAAFLLYLLVVGLASKDIPIAYVHITARGCRFFLLRYP